MMNDLLSRFHLSVGLEKMESRDELAAGKARVAELENIHGMTRKGNTLTTFNEKRQAFRQRCLPTSNTLLQ